MRTQRSADYGATFASTQASAGADITPGAMDLVRIGPGALMADDADINIATTAGGSYSSYSTVPTDATPAAIVIPRYEIGSTSTSNANTTPEYILASSTLSDVGAALWEVTASGATLRSITPSDGTDDGLAVDHRCIAMPWRSGARMAAILLFDETRKLLVSTTIGGGTVSWTVRDSLTADANMVTYRKGDTTLNELYGTDGDAWYSPDHGANLYTKSAPDTPLILVNVYG